jgi:hypothetical protein
LQLIIRQKGERRWNQGVKFPLNDSEGVLVILDRRRQPDRRKARCGPDDLMVVLSKMS